MYRLFSIVVGIFVETTLVIVLSKNLAICFAFHRLVGWRSFTAARFSAAFVSNGCFSAVCGGFGGELVQ